ncbi:MAG TPA: DJ-1/PfpI family protein, partial [Iamia sp.]|nr:DJ-1/PfpI family protein [Iamia sp.]
MQVAIGLYDGFTALDFVGPYQVLTNVPGVEVVLVTAEPGTVSDDMGLLHLHVATGLDAVDRPDIVVVPGGPGTNVAQAADSALVSWLKG